MTITWVNSTPGIYKGYIKYQFIINNLYYKYFYCDGTKMHRLYKENGFGIDTDIDGIDEFQTFEEFKQWAEAIEATGAY